ncbi:CPBP family intramembrane glutamic endopeptidase [Fibrella forsythiae]|uniref:CPBP family intramembrane metalloprotease n=1 Tax=Fibrella forsythiae TaxID=2817061 RepID=A0ABS3JT76_9BACT|nr:CPBP family intramembrane glutamic endopeptidase [Fibrella forsythiae]MBO0953214.1 CPBP family intramembrane metalloprotease [Fibrella forsythiae]
MSSTSNQPVGASALPAIKPLPFGRACLYFGASALWFRLCVYHLMPGLLRAGAAPFWAFISSYTLALTALIVATWLALRKEGYPINYATFRGRLRFAALTYRGWAWTLSLFVLGFCLTGLLLPAAQVIARLPALAPPSFLPAVLNPLVAQSARMTQFMGESLAGQWWLLLLYALFLTVFNLLGEELWFRGYLFPRQQVVHGSSTWLVHGLLWTLFHVPIYPWYLLYLLPTALSVSYVAQKTSSSWAAYVVHGLGNGLLVLVPLTSGVLGNRIE